MNLTKRQTQILELSAQGHTAEQTAAILHRSVGTVRRHIVLACARVGARNVTHLVAMSISKGWLNVTFSLFLSVVMVSDIGGDQLRNMTRIRVQRTQVTRTGRKEA